jgi:1-acyl-sn-glycerol-3-phosphate acyltransferase
LILVLSVLAVVVLALILRRRSAARPEIRGILRPLWWLNVLYCALWHRLEVRGRAPLPEHGPAILIANHTCGIDHMVLQAGCRRVLGFLIAQEYAESWYSKPFCTLLGCIPVKRDGRDLTATRAALRALDDGRVLPIFPEGKILASSGRELGEAKPGAAYIALRSGAPVIPAYIQGTPKTAEIIRSLVTPSRTRVVFGSPITIDVPPGDDRESERRQIEHVTEQLMAAIRALKDANPPSEH